MEVSRDNKKSKRNPRNEGYKFEEQLLLHACISLRRLQCQNFSVLPEDKDFPKFDDIVCKHEHGGKSYRIAIQAKFGGSSKNINECVLKENKDYKLDQYIEAIGEIQKSFSDCEIFFILITPRKMGKNILQSLIESSDAINVITEIFTDMFNNPRKTKAFQFKYTFLKQILPNYSEELLNYALSRFIFITEAPNVNDLKIINKNLLFGEQTDINVDSLYEIFKEEVVKFTEDGKSKEEATITREKFNILLSALFEKDLTKISEDFLKNEYSFNVNFNENFLNEVNDKLKICNFIKCYENIKLHGLIILNCVKKLDSNALLIPISKLKDFHLDLIEKNIIILIEEEKSYKCLIKKPNIYYVGKIIMDDDSNSKLPSFSYDSLSLDSKRNFESQYIDVQGYKVSLGELKGLSNEYEHIMSNVFIDLFNGKKLIFCSNLPKNTNFDTHVERDFSIGSQEKKNDEKEKQIVLEKNIFKIYNRCIIMGDSGMGKSFTLMNMMINFKHKNPQYLIKFIDLKLIHIFLTRFPKDEPELINFIKNLNNKHLLVKFLIFEENHEKELLINLYFLEYYLSFQEPRIIIIFDGFDEIMPTYSDTFLNLVIKLIHFKVKIFISGQSHSYEELKKLDNFDNLTIKPYTEDQVKDFIEKYYKMKQEEYNFLNNNLLNSLKLSASSIFNHKTKNSFIYTPLYLKMLMDIVIEYYKNNKNTNHIIMELNDIDILTLYDKIFEISFNNYYEKEGINPMSNIAISQKKSRMRHVRRMYGKLAYKTITFDLENVFFKNPIYDVLKSSDWDEMEILGRGFVKRSSSQELYFIHRTFAEYFLASYLFDKFIKNNIFKTVNDSNKWIYFNLMTFMCPMLIRSLKKKSNVDTDNMLRIFSEEDDIEDQMKYFLFIIEYCWKNYTMEIPLILNFLFNSFQLEDLIENKNLLKFNMFHQFNKPEQIYLIFALRRPKYTKCKIVGKISKYLEMNLIKSMNSILIRFEDFLKIDSIYMNSVDKRRLIKFLLIHNVVNKKIGNYNGNTTDKLIWCIWKYIYLAHDPILKCSEINTILKALNKKNKEKTIIKFVMFAINEAIINNTFSKSPTFDKFIENILLFSITSCNFFEFFLLLNPNSYISSIMLSHDIKICGKVADIFILSDNNSILYHLCNNKDENRIIGMMKFFSKNKTVLDDLVNGPYFEGKSFEVFYKSYILNHGERNICLEILNTSYHFIKESYDEFKNLLSVYNEKTNIYKAIKHDLTILYFLSLYLYEFENKRSKKLSDHFMSIMENIIGFFYNNLLKLNKESEFLCEIARISECDILNRNDAYIRIGWDFNPYKNILYILFKFLLHDFNEKLLLDCDSDGNNPVLVCALENNCTFFEVIYKTFPCFDSMIEMLNKKTQNFFHCIRSTNVSQTRTFFTSIGFENFLDSNNGKIKLNKFILQKDIDEKTPFHRSENLEYLLMHFRFYMNDDTFVNLFKIKDKEGNNIIHYLSMHRNNQRDDRDPNYTIWPLKELAERLPVVESMKEALSTKNKNILTPLDICRTCEFCTKESLLELNTYCGKLLENYNLLLKDLK